MADIDRSPRRCVQRRYERNRLEDQFWTMAYEEIWPVVRRSLQRHSAQPRACVGTDTETQLARRA